MTISSLTSTVFLYPMGTPFHETTSTVILPSTTSLTVKGAPGLSANSAVLPSSVVTLISAPTRGSPFSALILTVG